MKDENSFGTLIIVVLIVIIVVMIYKHEMRKKCALGGTCGGVNTTSSVINYNPFNPKPVVPTFVAKTDPATYVIGDKVYNNDTVPAALMVAPDAPSNIYGQVSPGGFLGTFQGIQGNSMVLNNAVWSGVANAAVTTVYVSLAIKTTTKCPTC